MKWKQKRKKKEKERKTNWILGTLAVGISILKVREPLEYLLNSIICLMHCGSYSLNIWI